MPGPRVPGLNIGPPPPRGGKSSPASKDITRPPIGRRIDLAEWLKSLGLGRYVPTLRSNDVNSKVLPELMADDLVGSTAP